MWPSWMPRDEGTAALSARVPTGRVMEEFQPQHVVETPAKGDKVTAPEAETDLFLFENNV